MLTCQLFKAWWKAKADAKALGTNTPPSGMRNERAAAEAAYLRFATHLSVVMTAFWLPLLAVVGLLLGWCFWAHPLSVATKP